MGNINNILLIDEPGAGSISKQILKLSNAGAYISISADSNEALEDLRTCIRVNYEDFPDVIFLDPEKPGLDGWAFLDALHRFPEWIVKKCKVFVLSTANPASLIEKVKNYSMVSDVLPKPLEAGILDPDNTSRPDA